MRYSNVSALGVCLFSGFVIACASGTGTTLAPENLDLSGSWILNTDLSDDPQEMMPDGGMPEGGMGGRPGGMGGGRPTGGMGGGRPPGGMGGKRGMGGGAPSEADLRRMQQTIRMAAEVPGRIDVSHQDSTINIREAFRPSLTVHTNWEKVRQDLDNDTEVEIRARWHERQLQIERKVQNGGKILEKYTLSQSTNRLHVEKSVDMEMGRGQTLTFHYVYDPAEEQS